MNQIVQESRNIEEQETNRKRKNKGNQTTKESRKKEKKEVMRK